MDRLTYTVADVAEHLAIGRNRVYDLIAAGELPHLRIGRTIRVPADHLAAWIAARTEGHPDESPN